MPKRLKLILLVVCFLLLLTAGVMIVVMLNRPETTNGNASSIAGGMDNQPAQINKKAELTYAEQEPVPITEGCDATRMRGFIPVDGEPSIAFFTWKNSGESDPILEFCNPFNGEVLYRTAAAVSISQINRLTLDAEKNLWIVSYDTDARQMSIEAYDTQGKILQGKTVLKDLILDGEAEHPEWSAIEKLAVDQDRIYVLNVSYSNYTLQIFDHSGTQLEVLPGVIDFETDQKGGLYLYYDKSSSGNDPRTNEATAALVKRDVLSGEKIWSVPAEGLSTSLIWYCQAMDCVVGFSMYEVVRFSETAKNPRSESILKIGVDTSFMNTDLVGDLSLAGGAMRSDGTIYLLLLQNFREDGTKPPDLLYAYPLREKPATEADTILKITAPYPQEYLLESVAKYQKSNPNVKIELDTAYASHEEFKSFSAEQYGQQLTLRIISNDVGDIVMTGGSGLDTANVLRTDAFLELSGRIQEEAAAVEWNPAIVDAVRLNTEIRGLPIGVLYQYLDVNLTLKDKLGLEFDPLSLKWSDVLKIAREVEEKDPEIAVFGDRHQVSFENAFYSFLLANSNDLVDYQKGVVDLSQPWFTVLLEEWDYQRTHPAFIRETPFRDSVSDTALQSNTLFALGFRSQTGNVNDSIWRFYNWEDEFGNTHRYVPMPMGEKQPNRIAYTNMVYSISANTKAPDEAWGFLCAMLDADAQISRSLAGSPINMSAMEKQIKFAQGTQPELMEQCDKYHQMMQPVYRGVETLFEPFLFGGDVLPLTEYMNSRTNGVSLEDALYETQQNLMLRVNE